MARVTPRAANDAADRRRWPTRPVDTTALPETETSASARGRAGGYRGTLPCTYRPRPATNGGILQKGPSRSPRRSPLAASRPSRGALDPSGGRPARYRHRAFCPAEGTAREVPAFRGTACGSLAHADPAAIEHALSDLGVHHRAAPPAVPDPQAGRGDPRPGALVTGQPARVWPRPGATIASGFFEAAFELLTVASLIRFFRPDPGSARHWGRRGSYPWPGRSPRTWLVLASAGAPCAPSAFGRRGRWPPPCARRWAAAAGAPRTRGRRPARTARPRRGPIPAASPAPRPSGVAEIGAKNEPCSRFERLLDRLAPGVSALRSSWRRQWRRCSAMAKARSPQAGLVGDEQERLLVPHPRVQRTRRPTAWRKNSSVVVVVAYTPTRSRGMSTPSDTMRTATIHGSLPAAKRAMWLTPRDRRTSPPPPAPRIGPGRGGRCPWRGPGRWR